jgi:glycosyltransferase involved in cell wall biosynthesis
MIHANLLARLVRLSTNVPRLVCTAHNTNEGGRLRMMAYRLTDFLADVSTNVSREAVEAFEAKGAVPRGKMLAVLNAIDCDVFSPDVQPRLEIRQAFSVDRDTMVFIAVGRLFEAKDYPNLLTAFAEVSASLPNSCLWIVGDGPLRVELENMSGDLGLAERVRFLGVRHDIPALLRAADVFVLSSSWEGFGLVVAEAMATGTRVVATDCGGVREVVGDCGYLVPPCDSKALGNAMLVAANLSAEQVETLGRTARQRIVELFSLDRAVDRWLEIYSGKGV